MTFRTLHGEGEGFFKDRGSKFYSFAYRVKSTEEVDARLSVLRTKFHDARHHCYAYLLGQDQQSYRANDDGEPRHSAGDPILGQIRSHEVTDALVVVIRYFGGTKLGVPGLINAYRESAHLALADAGKVTIVPHTSIKVVFNYDETSIVEKLISDFDLTIDDRNYTEVCEMLLSVEDTIFQRVKSELKNLNLSFTVQDSL